MDSQGRAHISAHRHTLRAQSAALHELCAEVRRESIAAIAESKIAIAQSRAELARSRQRREDRSQIP
jgi:hypothetical protein